MITISDYKPTWVEAFDAIRESFLEILGTSALRIDHIGSTSVPGLGAKDVIDIQVTVQALTPKVNQRLMNAGYQCWETIAHDHVPFGKDENLALWEKLFFYQPEGQRRANLQAAEKVFIGQE